MLNLPDIILFKNGNQIINSYDAGGQKLSTRYYTLMYTISAPVSEKTVLDLSYNPDIIEETGTFYIGNYEYGFNGCDPGWYWKQRINNAEGYISCDNEGKYDGYLYYRRDHLGNNREVWNANANATVQRTQYYPSGLPWASNSGDNPGTQNKKYNGKEFVEMHGYDSYDYGARGYYPAMGRWTSVDPLAEKYYSISPYAYCLNNPVRFIDPDGMRVETGSMTKDEQKEYDKTIAVLSESDLFKTLYSTLVKSDKVYNISFGKTEKDKSGNPVPGNFKPDSKTDGGSVTFLKGSNLNSSVTTEELVHAYQNENKTLENPNINPEFEAKTITQLVGEGAVGYGSYKGMTNYQSFLESEYHNVLSPKDVNSSKFQSNYQNSAILYSAYNQTNNIADANYNRLTLQKPATLMRLINNTYLKNMP